MEVVSGLKAAAHSVNVEKLRPDGSQLLVEALNREGTRGVDDLSVTHCPGRGWRASESKTIVPGLRGSVGGFAGIDEVTQFL